jgi:hypothetical protein
LGLLSDQASTSYISPPQNREEPEVALQSESAVRRGLRPAFADFEDMRAAEPMSGSDVQVLWLSSQNSECTSGIDRYSSRRAVRSTTLASVLRGYPAAHSGMADHRFTACLDSLVSLVNAGSTRNGGHLQFPRCIIAIGPS